MFLKFIIGLFALFVVPFLIIFNLYICKKLNNSLKLLIGYISSLTLIWIVFLLSFYLELSNKFLLTFSSIISFFGLYLLYESYKKYNVSQKITLLSLILIVSLLCVFLLNVGRIFTQWDAVVSWNRWALEFYSNTYNPVHSAYPILIPALWSLLYKIQGTSDIWWTVKLSLFFVPFFTIYILRTFYIETRKISFLYILFFTLLYVTWSFTYSGYMDTIVLIMGITSLTLLKASEIEEYKKDYDLLVYSALILSGISAIVKQPGLGFLLFNIIYISFFSFKRLQSKKKLLLSLVISFFYFLSFLIIYLSYQSDLIGTIDELKSLSYQSSGNYLYDMYNLLILFLKKPMPLLVQILIPIAFILLVYVNKKNLRVTIHTLFVIVGFIIWAKTTSYGSRNAIWLHAFIIVGSSYFFSKYELLNDLILIEYDKFTLFDKFVSLIFKTKLKYVLGVFMLYVLWPTDKVVRFIQYEQQKRFGNPDSARHMLKLLNGKENTCLKIYTNSQKTKYNYYVRRVNSQIEQFGGSPSKSILEHNCKEGRYIHMPYMPADKTFDFEKFKIINNLKYIGYDKFYFIEPINKDEK